MSKLVLFRDNQEVTGTDLANAGTYAQEAMDTIVADGITSERRYAGFTIATESSTSVSIQPGRLYQDGKVFIQEGVETINLSNQVPLANKRLVAIVAFGDTIETETQPRDYLIDIATLATEPRAVDLLGLRSAQLAVSGGVASVDPQLPAIAANSCLIAIVTMGTAGVLSVENFSPNRLPSVQKNAEDIAALKVFQAQTEPKVAALTSELAALAIRTQGKADQAALLDVMRDVARVKDKAGLPATYTDYDADFFTDASKIDTALSGATYKLQDGVLFPDAASATAPLALFNPYDSNVYRSPTDLVLPKFTAVPVLKTDAYVGDLSISQYQVQTHTIKQKTTYTYYHRFGWRWNWWPYYYLYRWTLPAYQYLLARQGYFGYWRAVPTTTYEDVVSTTSYNGVLVAQTFVAPRAGWVPQIDLFFTKVGAVGDVTMMVCETVNGKPDLSKVLTRVTVPVADIKKYPVATPFTLPVAFLEAGARYAWVVVTQGDHYIARVDANSYTQGTLFYGSDGEYFQGDLTKDAMFTLYMAQFAAPRSEVILQNISLAGGITDLEIAAQQLVPDGTELTFEVQVAGRWYPLKDNVQALQSAPDIVPLRAVFLGTSDVAPAIQLAPGVIKASRPATAFMVFSTLRTLASAQSHIRVDLVGQNFDGAKNTMAVVLTDAAGANPVTASVVEDVPSEDGSTRKRFTFNLGSPRSTYKMKITGTRTSDGPPFALVERTDIAY